MLQLVESVVPGRRSPARAVATLLLIAGAAAAPLCQSPDESRLKAAFVAKFPAFVQWPDRAWGNSDAVVICVHRADVAAHLRELVSGEHLNGRRFDVKRIDAGAPVEACHVMFLSGPAEAVLPAVSAKPILTIGDDPEFLARGGIIGLRVVDRRIRFDVDRDAADRAGLKLSSQLLRLALTVRGGGR